MSDASDYSVANLVLKNLKESRQLHQQDRLIPSLYALTQGLKLRLGHEFRPETKETLDQQVHKAALEITKSDKFHQRFGPVSVKLGENQVLYDFLNSILSVEMEEYGAQREDCLAKAQKLLNQRKFDEARDIMNALLMALPDDVGLRLDVGNRYLNKELYEDAEMVFREAQAMDPKSIIIINRLGIAFRKMGRYDEAITEYRKALKISPRDPNLYYNLALVFYVKKDYANTLQGVERSLKLKPDFEEAIALKSNVQNKLGSASYKT
ncbi:MAG: tetratricopeptide repeat protein [Deltaproteobacteria bacterium]|nr:tetratricopeptide repeat protein [Deltaproteobacteria bacterium]